MVYSGKSLYHRNWVPFISTHRREFFASADPKLILVLIMFQLGCDLSENLCLIARNKNCEVLRADCLALPFKSNSADAIISIAVIHHMSTEKRRCEIL